MTDFDDLEISVLRHYPLNQDEKERAAALQVVGETALPLRQRVATALASLSYRIDPSVDFSAHRAANN
ncbi:MAG: hypothetical protein AB7P33_09535 [Dehalococcoidia bacterium]